MAENYLQHAEHYFRILSAAQPQAGQRDQFGQQGEEDDYDDDFAPINDRFASPEPRQPYQQSQPQPEPQPIPGSEPVVMAVVEVAAPVDGETAAAPAEGEPRRHRERRPRRRSRGQGGDGVAGDPANAPQPDVGELPAFLTAGSTAAE